MSQLALPLTLDDYAVFDTFWPSGNEALIAFLEDLCAESSGPGCWIWGKPATGKSHLLQAVCERLGDRSVFLPLKELSAIGPGILDGVAERRFVCIDDVHTVAGQGDWEHALFYLFNSAAESESRLVVSSHAPPRDSGIALADLRSRFSLLPIFQLHALDEEGRRAALKLRARHRGLDLPDKTARYLTQRSRRDMGSLYELLDRLDSQALVAQRRLTIPFVKSILE